MPVPQGSPGDRLLEDLGYRVRWTSWVLKLPEGATIPERDLPDGYVVRTAEPGELRAAHDVLEDAFLEWSERDREPFEDFEAATTGRPGFEPWNLRVALDPAGEVVGVSLVLVSDNGTTGYVDRLAVRRDQRNRGLAQALLVDSFARAREHGTTTSELSTDSRTGALGLYERVGMVPTASGSIGRSTCRSRRKASHRDEIRMPKFRQADGLDPDPPTGSEAPTNRVCHLPSIDADRAAPRRGRGAPVCEYCGGWTCKIFMLWSSRTIRTSRQRWWRPSRGRVSG